MYEEVADTQGRTVTFDRKKLAELGFAAMGNRRISEVVEQTGLSRSTISKLLNQNMKSPPAVVTLRRLADDNRLLLRQMMEACGYRPDIQDDLTTFRRFVDETPVHSDTTPARIIWSASLALAMVLDSLKGKGDGRKIQIDYRTDGIFAVDIGEKHSLLICIPVVLTDLQMGSRDMVKLVLEKIALGITQWGLDDTATLILTDSLSVFRLLKKFPNLSQIMAVAVASDDGRGFKHQYTLQPLQPLTDTLEEFPVDLTKDCEQIVSDEYDNN